MVERPAIPDAVGADLAPAIPKLLGHPHDRLQRFSTKFTQVLPFRPTGRTRRALIGGEAMTMHEHANGDGCRMWSTAPRLCPCGRRSVGRPQMSCHRPA